MGPVSRVDEVHNIIVGFHYIWRTKGPSGGNGRSEMELTAQAWVLLIKVNQGEQEHMHRTHLLRSLMNCHIAYADDHVILNMILLIFYLYEWFAYLYVYAQCVCSAYGG